MEVIKGSQARLAIQIEGIYYYVFCAIGCSFFYQFEDLRTTTRTSGKFRNRESGLCDWGFSLNGLTKIDNSDGQIAFFYLLQAGIRGEVVSAKMEFIDDAGNEKTIVGDVLVQSGQLDAQVGGFANVSQTFPGSGPFEMDVVESPVPDGLYKVYLSTTEGASSVTAASIAGATEIMLVIRESGGFTETSGTPTGREFKYTNSGTNGTLAFDPNLPFNPGEIVYCQFKKPV